MKLRRSRLFIYAGLSITVMCLIFYLSSQPAPVSQRLSDGILYKIMIFLGFEDEEMIMGFGKLIRKIAHFCEYGVLSVCLGLFFCELSLEKSISEKVPFAKALLFACAYAASDEVHQYFVPGRSMQLGDVLLDAAGAAVGLCGLWYLKKLSFIDREERKDFE